MVDPDLELVEATGRGDQEAFESLVKRYQGPLLNFITRFGDRCHGGRYYPGGIS